jgi:hypothetical protein
MMPTEVAVPDSAVALRKLRRSEINSSGRIRKQAFMPRAQGQDRDGLSVSIETTELQEVHRVMFETDDHRAARLKVIDIRGIELDVKADPDEQDRAHALIVGIPDRTLGRVELEKAERFAQQLARLATPYSFAV